MRPARPAPAAGDICSKPGCLVQAFSAQLDRVLAAGAHADIQHLDADRERHREVDVALRDVKVQALRRSAPRRPGSGTQSASILTVGCRSTNSPIGRAANIMTTTAATIASTMTGDLVDHADRRDHRIEREHDVDDARSARSRPRTRRAPPPRRVSAPRSSPSSELWISWTPSTAGRARRRSGSGRGPRSPCPSGMENSGSRQRHHPRQREQQHDARQHREARGRAMRARWRCSSGRRPTRIEMKMMLSTPRTISSAVSVEERDPGLRVGQPFHHYPGHHGDRAEDRPPGQTVDFGCRGIVSCRAIVIERNSCRPSVHR